MTWSPISNTVPQYQASDGSLASGYYLKFYNDGTTTPINMATDSTGGTTLAKCQLNASGYPINGSSAVFIPHIDQTYKLVLYTNSADADADTTANAVWIVDGLQPALTNANLADVTLGDSLIGVSRGLTNAVDTTLDSWIESQIISLNAEYQINSNQTAAYNATYLQNAIDDAPAHSTLYLDDSITINTGIDITNKTDLRITGRGSITLTSATSTDRIFNLVGTISRLRIDGLTLIGENNAAYYQAGIGCDSGQTVSDVCFDHLRIKQINVGISLNAYSSGSYTKAVVAYNNLSDIVGVLSGQGYGLHAAKCSNLIAIGNIIDNASRHGIYQAAGTNLNNIWADNIITNHRLSVATAALITAFNVARSTGVTIIGNKIIDFSDGGMYIAHETATSENCGNIKVIGNEFRGRKNVQACITIGEQAVPGTYTTDHITIEGNDFYTDETVSGTAGNDIAIYNGNNLSVKGNKFRRDSLTTTTTYIALGNNSYITDDADCEDVAIVGNEFIANGTTTATRGVTFASDISTNTSKHKIKGNFYTNMSHPTFHASIPTNPNLDVVVENRPRILNGTGASIAAGTTAGYVKTTTTIRIAYDGKTASVAATDDFFNLQSLTTAAGEYCKVLLCLDGAGTQARVVKGEVAATQAAAIMPVVPDFDWVPIGIVELSPSYSGGAVSTLYDIVGVYP